MGDFKAVIFDLDGTLYKSKFLPLLCVLKSPKDALRMRAERLARRGAKGFEWDSVTSMEADFAQRISRFSGGSAVAVSQWRIWKFPQIQADVLKHHCSARKGAKELILGLAGAGIKIAVLSDYGFAGGKMEAIGLGGEVLDAVAGVFSAQDFACLKPSARAFLKVAEKMQVLPSECLVVGDRDDTDGEGARKSGMSFILITDSNKKRADGTSPVMKWRDFLDWAGKNLVL